MTQGLPERPPPGHAAHALRHFVRDAVVFDDYRIAEGMVIPQGALRRRYHPETCPTLPQQLARLTRGDTTAVLAFVRRYGLLGYAALAAAVGRGAPSDAAGDPLGWIWAHAETVALCLHLTYGLQAGDDAALQHVLRAVQLPQPPQTEGGPQLMLPAVWDQPRVPFHWASPLHSPEDWRTYARAIRRDVLNAHLHGIHPQCVEREGREQAGCHFQALLAVVYWHLLHVSLHGVVHRCAEPSCQACFVPTRRTQRFCPAEAPARGSRCAMRDVRMLSDLLLTGDDWSPGALRPYAEERQERMRRLRFCNAVATTLRGEFGPEARERRRRAQARMQAEPELALWRRGSLAGLDTVPAAAFDEHVYARLFSPAVRVDA